MMDENINILSSILSAFKSLTKKPELYLSVQEDNALKFKTELKKLYDHTKSSDKSNHNSQALQRMIIDKFDEEQIWQQLELQNNSTWNGFLANISRLCFNKQHLLFCNYDRISDDSDDDDENDEYKHKDVGDEMSDVVNIGNIEDSCDENLLEIFGKYNSKAKCLNSEAIRKPYKSSIVDDKFFKFCELQQFLNEEDCKNMNGMQEKFHRDGDSDNSIDLFEDLDANLFSDDENVYNENYSDDETNREKYPRYEDFFDAPEDLNHDQKDELMDEVNVEDCDDLDDDNLNYHDSDDKSKNMKRVKFQISQSESGDDSSDDYVLDKPDLNPGNNQEEKSTFQIRQERLKKKIDHLENAALAQRPWQLKGEIDAANRPQNSLLEEVLEFDLLARPAPIITQETTLKLEDIIRQRIKDKAWDDVERKIKPIDAPLEYKKELALNQEKSKESLAKIYEQEYLKQQAALYPDCSDQPEEVPKEQTAIEQMMISLFAQLDALSNFHYTPKTVMPEVKIISNLPVISMEEVAPVATSDATLLTPEEIQKKSKGDVVSKDERTKTDKIRERRQKKIRQQIKNKKQEIIEKLNPNSNKFNKQKQSKLINKLFKNRNIGKLVNNTKTAKSSQAFFTQLQEVQGQISNKIKS
ncbi:U3 small nucleolar ribonucleoprotein protein MPP10 isoform X2 [Ctenocephalides felis]|uniref:U3 small nucleolar ribonucleoprotein protein MPP10 isoform X2 n=1 Tax=Ctenocephalides felis TaxID=7515 RepID=UPI000E6E2D32|nr:U3 small nucleolar ribonucleoprotein protein MPP10 isoform X2 [Ctenocephalides felis]